MRLTRNEMDLINRAMDKIKQDFTANIYNGMTEPMEDSLFKQYLPYLNKQIRSFLYLSNPDGEDISITNLYNMLKTLFTNKRWKRVLPGMEDFEFKISLKTFTRIFTNPEQAHSTHRISEKTIKLVWCLLIVSLDYQKIGNIIQHSRNIVFDKVVRNFETTMG